ncbi:MAG: hypothetical protein M3245_03280, partial [Actinomycetota bacterium]|nr:hypothetical protein [Actinomycetota bacterium]
TSAEAALVAGAAAVLGAAPAGARAPVPVDPGAVGRRAAELAKHLHSDVVVVAEPRVGSEDDRRGRARPVLQSLRTAGVPYSLVPNQGAELLSMVRFEERPVVVVSATGGTAFNAALVGGAPAVCFATTARVEGLTGWDVVHRGAVRAIELAREHQTGITVVASTANSADDCMAAFEVARAILAEGFLRP